MQLVDLSLIGLLRIAPPLEKAEAMFLIATRFQPLIMFASPATEPHTAQNEDHAHGLHRGGNLAKNGCAQQNRRGRAEQDKRRNRVRPQLGNAAKPEDIADGPADQGELDKPRHIGKCERRQGGAP